MADPSVFEAMRADWNQRAEEDANYYVAFGRRDQPEQEFFASSADQVRAFETELRRKPAAFWKTQRALEIGCGPGRLLRPLRRHFREIHGLDISDEMIRRARSNFRDSPNVHLHLTRDSSLSAFRDESFSFVYSYAVFQHIPNAEVIHNYLHDAVRVLAPGGLFVFQINGLPDAGHSSNTWNGARVGAEEIVRFARSQNLLLLQLNDKDTQYMWVTLQKPERTTGEPAQPVRLAKLRNAFTGDPVIPAGGRFAAAAICLENLPPQADLLSLDVRFDARSAYAFYVSPEMTGNGIREINAMVPPGTRTGLVRFEVYWRGKLLFPPVWARLLPPTARVPRVCSLGDGINLLTADRVESGFGKLVLEEIAHPEQIRIAIDGQPVRSNFECINPFRERWEFNFFVPSGTSAGSHSLTACLGYRTITARTIQICGHPAER